MSKVKVSAYASDGTVLLVMDWDGKDAKDFIGFAVKRGVSKTDPKAQWIPNRLGFDGPHVSKKDLGIPSDKAPIQKNFWYDPFVDKEKDPTKGRKAFYNVYPVLNAGTAAAPKVQLQMAEAGEVQVDIPATNDDKQEIGSTFNRATTSSQSFVNEFGKGKLSGKTLLDAQTWLADGLEKFVPGMIARYSHLEGAVYHLTDEVWVLPAVKKHQGFIEFTLDATQASTQPAKGSTETPPFNLAADYLKGCTGVKLRHRTKVNISHDKVLVGVENNKPVEVLMGSANFTTAGLSQQANVLHRIRNQALAQLYYDRLNLISQDPDKKTLSPQAKWSTPIKLKTGGTASVFFPPEPASKSQAPSYKSIQPIVDAIRKAKRGVFFALFDPTDKGLLAAILETAKKPQVPVYGLINRMPKPGSKTPGGPELVTIGQMDKELVGADNLRADAPTGFAAERLLLQSGGPAVVVVHLKAVLVDPGTPNSHLFTGSANISKNSATNNDENILHVQGNRYLEDLYLAEIMRLHAQYRFRYRYNQAAAKDRVLKLRTDNSWLPAESQIKAFVANYA